MGNLYYAIAFLLCLLIFNRLFRHRSRNLPPSPPSIPVIGHLYLIKAPLHLALDSLLSQYGPILYLKLGSRSMLVVSSPSLVEECFTKNDVVLANRPRSMAGDYFTYNYTALAWAPYGYLWRVLRRLTVIELFSSNSLQKSSFIREEETRTLVRQLYKVSTNGNKSIDLSFCFSVLSFNIMMRVVAGKQCVKEEEGLTEVGKNSLEEMKGIFFSTLLMNMCDFFPVLRVFGYKGIEKSMIVLQKKRDEFLQGLIDEFIKENKTSFPKEETQKKTLIETLLLLQESEPEFYSIDVIRSIILTMFVAGTETSSVTMECAISLLLDNPHALQKARSEIDKQVGHKRSINDSDLTKLPYLRCIINETLRLYPPAPLLLPHCSSEHCTIGGFKIPPNTTLVVNAWAMHRDPKVWEEPNEFKPERFEGDEGFKFAAFGIGRRACPGANLAIRMISLALGALIQCFEWERVGTEEVDMAERVGLNMPKAKPLEVLCKPRASMIDLLSKM
ncbi:hypothetical protein LguiA_003970 [Lonicera macranthoides]